jgi:hypothetical protein
VIELTLVNEETVRIGNRASELAIFDEVPFDIGSSNHI